MRARQIAGGTLSLFALGMAVGLVAFRSPPSPPTAAPAASACPPTKAEARAKAAARKAAAEACLRSKLPHAYEPSMYPQVQAAVAECLGKTQREIAKTGVTRFRFGHSRNGRSVDVMVPCGVQCFDIATPVVVHSYGGSTRNCLCMRDKPLLLPRFGYEGCRPAGHTERHLAFSIEPASGRKDLYRVMGGRPGTRLGETGIEDGDILLSADGRPIRSPAAVQKVMLRFSNDPPRSVTVEGADLKTTEIRYVEWDAIQRLDKHMKHARSLGGWYPPICCDAGDERLTIYQGLTIAPKCHDAKTRAWLAFAREVGRTHATPGISRGPGNFPGCKSLFRTRTTFRGLSGGKVVVIKYVGWLGLPVGAVPDGGT